MSKVLLLACILNCCLALQVRQHDYDYYSNYNYPSYRSTNSSNNPSTDGEEVGAVIFMIIICAFCGAACYYCCKAIRNRSSNAREYVGNPPPTQFAAPLNNNQFNSPPSYPAYRQPVQAGIPVAENISPGISPYGVATDRDRLNSACDFCSTRYKLGEEPRAMVSCPAKHIFHLSCLASAVKLQNDLTCPHCNTPIPSTIKLYCISCKTNNATVDLSEFRHASEGLDLPAIKRRFG